MGFTINTNIQAMNAQVNTGMVQHKLSGSLEKLSSGLRINKAADDSSGMAIADSLRSQSSSLGQAIRNTNDAIGMVQIADKAMDEQIKILDTIKVKAAQAAQDSQNSKSRQAIQADITRLVEQLDNIALQTSYNGINLLAGSFTNKEFQVGAYSNETIKASIGATTSNKIGAVRKETSKTITAAGTSTLTFQNPTGGADIKLESVKISTSAGTGLGALVEVINKNSDALGVRATATVQTTGSAAVKKEDLTDFKINGITIGTLSVKANDEDGVLVNSINAFTANTGVKASLDVEGKLNLTSVDGRGIKVENGPTGVDEENYGRLTLTSLKSNDIKVSDTGALKDVLNEKGKQATLNLRKVIGTFSKDEAAAGGAFANAVQEGAANATFGTGVTSREGAMMVMDIAQSAIELLDRVRADIGSVQQQLNVTKNNISVTQVNVAAAESGIRNVDFGKESSNFQTQNILVQSGSYALAQSNSIQQNVMRLLQ